jgi:hypothetical protein
MVIDCVSVILGSKRVDQGTNAGQAQEAQKGTGTVEESNVKRQRRGKKVITYRREVVRRCQRSTGWLAVASPLLGHHSLHLEAFMST